MKKHFLFFLLFIFPGVICGEDALFRVMTYNIRYDNSSIFSWDTNRWSNRRDPIANLIKSYDVDIIGTQEGLSGQVYDLANRLSNWDWYSVGRTNGKSKGEFAAIFYKKKIFDVSSKGTYWLSQTPYQPSIGWDANDYRIASWLILRHKASDKEFFVLNTHFDHKGYTARSESAKLILSELRKLPKGLPVIIMGDFNAPANSTPINTLTRIPYAADDGNALLRDSRMITVNKPEGPYQTFQKSGEFSVKNQLIDRIDFIFVSKSIEVLSYRVLTDSKNGNYFSDHLPVLVELLIH